MRGGGAQKPFRQGKRFFLSTGRENMNPCRFARANLGRDFVQALDNTGVFPAGFASPQPKSAPRKLRSTCELEIIEGFLFPTSAAGLTPGKGGGAKRPDKGRSQAVGVRVLSPSSFLPSTRKILGPAQRPYPFRLVLFHVSGRRDAGPYKQSHTPGGDPAAGDS